MGQCWEEGVQLVAKFGKCILDRWIYCNQEAIAPRALAMYKERPGYEEIKRQFV